MENKCIRETCPYLKNTNIKNNGGLYCCKMCKSDGLHGLLCQKRLIDINTDIDKANLFEKIINTQINDKAYYIKGPKPPRYGVSVKIKGNKIAEILKHPEQHNLVRVDQYIQLLKNTLAKHIVKDCYVNIQIKDVPVKGYFNFCRNLNNRGGVFLLPNHRFQKDDTQILDEKNTTATYDEEKALILSKNTPFETKQHSIYTSSSYQATRTAYYLYALHNSFCKGVLYCNPKKIPGPPAVFLSTLRQKGLVSSTFTPFINHDNYRYVLYTDGNTLSDRMRLLLCLNSVIIRKKSAYEEFYTYKMKNNLNYIEYSKEDELPEIYKQLESDSTLCNNIIENNKVFINETLTYDNILQYTADIINAIC